MKCVFIRVYYIHNETIKEIKLNNDISTTISYLDSSSIYTAYLTLPYLTIDYWLEH